MWSREELSDILSRMLESWGDAFENALERGDLVAAEFYANKLVDYGCEP